jgi:large subunit ribosomal protein L32e
MSLKELMQLKRSRRKRYLRINYYKSKSIDSRWRRAKGLHSKIRENRKGWPAKVKIGAGSPKEVKHMHYSCRNIVRIENIGQLEHVAPEKEIVIISKSVGKRNRVKILEKAIERKIRILNVNNPELAKKKLEDEFSSRIKKKEPKETKKEKKPEAKKTVKAEEKSPEDKKKEEKEEKDKILTKKV